MVLVDCAVKSADSAVQYYNGYAKSSYVTGLVANFALNLFAMVISNRFEREERIMMPVVAEVFCVLLFICSYNLTCFKTDILALSKKPLDLFISQVDQRIANVGKIFIKDYQFQVGLYGIMRSVSALNGIYYLNKNRVALTLSLLLLGIGFYGSLREVDDLFIQKAWEDCKRG